jgi:hypothetical protein
MFLICSHCEVRVNAGSAGWLGSSDPAGWRPKADYGKTVLCPVALDAGDLIKLFVGSKHTSRPSTRAHAREHQLGEHMDRHARAAKHRIPALM